MPTFTPAALLDFLTSLPPSQTLCRLKAKQQQCTLACSPALLLGFLLDSLLSISWSFLPECPACHTGASEKQHWDRAEPRDLVQRGTKRQVELSSYSKALHTPAYPNASSSSTPSTLPATGTGLATPFHSGQGSVQGSAHTPLGSFTSSWMSQNILWDTDQRKGTSLSAPHFTQLSGLADFCWYPQHSSRKPLQRHALTPTAAAFITAWGLSSSDPLQLLSMLCPPHFTGWHRARLARFQSPLLHLSKSWPFSALSWCIRGTVAQPKASETSTLQILSQKPPSGAQNLRQNKTFEHNAPWDHSFFLSPATTCTREPRASLPCYFWMQANPPLPLPSKMSDIADRPAPGIWLPSRLSLCSFHPVITDPCQETWLLRRPSFKQ